MPTVSHRRSADPSWVLDHILSSSMRNSPKTEVLGVGMSAAADRAKGIDSTLIRLWPGGIEARFCLAVWPSLQACVVDVGQSVDDACLGWLSDDERQRAERFKCDRARRQFVVGRVALRSLLSRRLDISPAAVTLTYEANGRPILSRIHGDRLGFSLSHSDDLAVVAIADGLAVGVDVERRRPIDARALAQRYFTLAEIEILEQSDELQCRDLFYRIWVRKEAAAKALGCGIGAGVHRIETARCGVGMTNGWIRMPDGELWPCLDLAVPGHFEAAVVGRRHGRHSGRQEAPGARNSGARKLSRFNGKPGEWR